MEDRLNKLEMLHAEQSQMLSDLSQEMYQQQQEIKRLTARVQLLEDKLSNMAEGGGIGGHERPPHY